MRRNHCSRSRCSTIGVFVTPAASVDDLLVGQHSGALRAPVHLALFAICKAALKHADEKPLVPAVVVGQAGRDLVRPVVAEADAAHLPLHGGDIRERPLARRSVVLDGRILRWQAEGVPAHGMEHVIALHPHVTGERVADGVIAHVAHVQLAGGIGQHLQHVIFGFSARCRLCGVEVRLCRPALLPAGFNFRRGIANFGRGLRRRCGGSGFSWLAPRHNFLFY